MKKICNTLFILFVVSVFLTGCMRNSNIEEQATASPKPLNRQASEVVKLIEEKSEKKNGTMYLTDYAFTKVQGYMRDIKPVEGQMTVPRKTNAKVSIWVLTSEISVIMDHEERRGYIKEKEEWYDIGYMDFTKQQIEREASKCVTEDATYIVEEWETVKKWSLGKYDTIVDLLNVSICEMIPQEGTDKLLLYDNMNYYLYDMQEQVLTEIASKATNQYAVKENELFWIDWEGHVCRTDFTSKQTVIENETGYNLTRGGYYSQGQFIMLD